MKNSFKKTTTPIFHSLFFIIIFFYSGNDPELKKTFTVKNNLDSDRTSETIVVPAEQVSSLIEEFGAESLQIREIQSSEPLLSQAIDMDSDGKIDEIIFQTDIRALEEKRFVIEEKQRNASSPSEEEGKAFSRFVPENNEDYAWENDRIAFRAYGRVTEARESGGRVSGGTSGIDAWFKRVSYPIIDKWYKKNQEEKSKKEEGEPHTDTYHTDTGEGYDPYMVGGSRGIGGTGIWENDSLYVSKPFIDYKRIATGPIRTIFELTYAPWQANNQSIHEKKRISLDLGSNLSRFEVIANSSEPLPNIAVGIALHDKTGAIKTVPEDGWFRYWEPIDDSELGVGIVVDTALMLDFKDQQKAPEQDNLLVLLDPEQNRVVYYAGYGWKKSGQFNSAEEWDRYLHNFSLRLASPLEINF